MKMYTHMGDIMVSPCLLEGSHSLGGNALGFYALDILWEGFFLAKDSCQHLSTTVSLLLPPSSFHYAKVMSNESLLQSSNK